MAKKKVTREVGSPITKEEYARIVLLMHPKLECLRDHQIEHVKMDFYFPEKELAINYSEMEHDDRMWLLYAKDIWARNMEPFEIAGEEVEFEWQIK